MRASTAADVLAELRGLGNPQQAKLLQRFFKTGPGEYGEGDVFLGLKVPVVRGVARRYRELSLGEVTRLLKAKEHEARLAALVILVMRFERGDEVVRRRVYELYLGHTRYINNWDLVDVSAPNIVGGFLVDKETAVLDKLAGSKLLWERRIAMLATLAFIREGKAEPTLRIARMLLNDEHDLIHKAVGWMLRELGKRNLPAERAFLDKHATEMPRTMLRYAIERLPEARRQAYMGR